MPKLQNRAPKYSKHKASGQAVVHLNGRDRYLGRYGSKESRACYQRLLSEWKVTHGLNVEAWIPDPLQRADLRICELLAAYLEHAITYYRKNGESTGEFENMKLAVKPLNEMFESELITNFGPLKLKLVRDRMVGSGLCRNQVNSRINRIRRVFKWGVENELVEPSILQALQAVAPLKRGRTNAKERPSVKPVSEEHVQKVIELATSPVRAMVELQRLTGMRPGEVIQMRACDIDRSKEIWVYSPASHKTEHHNIERRISIGPRGQRVLMQFLNRAGEEFLFKPSEAMLERRRELRAQSKDPKRRMTTKFRTRAMRGVADRYDTGAYQRAISRACKRAGIPTWGPNRLRHSAATLLREQFGIEAARVILGHSSATMTEVYAELDLSKAAEIMARVG